MKMIEILPLKLIQFILKLFFARRSLTLMEVSYQCFQSNPLIWSEDDTDTAYERTACTTYYPKYRDTERIAAITRTNEQNMLFTFRMSDAPGGIAKIVAF